MLSRNAARGLDGSQGMAMRPAWAYGAESRSGSRITAIPWGLSAWGCMSVRLRILSCRLVARSQLSPVFTTTTTVSVGMRPKLLLSPEFS